MSRAPHVITGRVPQRVVHDLEIIQVEEHQRRRRIPPDGQRQHSLRLALERAAVR